MLKKYCLQAKVTVRFAETHSAETPFAETNSLKGHFAERPLRRMSISPNGQFTESVSPKRHFAENENNSLLVVSNLPDLLNFFYYFQRNF